MKMELIRKNLTKRQWEVMLLHSDGNTQKVISELIGISRQAVGKHIKAAQKRIKKRLNGCI